ncbi:MAG: hypothetical protein NVSMB26_19920 [Beijerinckiaceae bacterium]
MNIGSVLSIDDDETYSNAVRGHVNNPDFELLCVDLVGPKRNQSDPEPNYSTYPLSTGRSYDLIYIDGRRRMECAMMALLLGDGSQVVVLHDYRRGRYQPACHFYDVIQDGHQFRVMRPKQRFIPRD